MQTIIQKLKDFNTKMMGLPKKITIIALVIIVFSLIVVLLPLLWPFILGFFLALAMRPVIRLSCEKLKLQKSRKIVAMVVLLIMYAILFLLFYLLFRRLIFEISNFAKNFPSLIAWVQDNVNMWVQKLTPAATEGAASENVVFVANTFETIKINVTNFLQNSIRTLTPSVATSAINWVSKLPKAILFIVMTIMSSFYFAMDKDKITGYLHKSLPPDFLSWFKGLTHRLSFATLQQIKAQIIISCTISLALVLGFAAFSIEYAVLAGVVIGMLDVLPIVGAGTFLIPWGAFNLFSGNLALGGKILFMYIIVIVIRQLIEPRIVGKKLGLYPLVSMFSMYVGLKLIGFLGLIAGPILANICKEILITEHNSSCKHAAQNNESHSQNKEDSNKGEKKDSSCRKEKSCTSEQIH